MKAWLAAEGENAVVDYLCPQIYWGCGYTLQSGSTRFAFENIVPEWLAMPRAASTALYFGLGAYRIGAGGWALYRYDSLFRSAQPELADAERAALAALTTA